MRESIQSPALAANQAQVLQLLRAYQGQGPTAGLPALTPDQFDRLGGQPSMNPAIFGALSQPTPGTTPANDPKLAALALLMAQAGPWAHAGPELSNKPLPLPAPGSASLGQSSNGPLGPNAVINGIAAGKDPNKMLADIGKGAVAAAALSYGSYMAMNGLDGSNVINGAINRERQATSGLSKIVRFLDTAPGLRNVSNAIDNRLAPAASKNQSLQQLMLRLSPTELETKVLGTEYDKFYQDLLHSNYKPEFREFLREKQLRDVLTGKPADFPEWARTGVLRQQVLTDPKGLSDDALRGLFDKIAPVVEAEQQLPSWAQSEESLERALKTRQPNAVQWIKEQITPRTDASGAKLNRADDILKDLGSEPRVKTWLDQHLTGELAKSPNQARHLALEEFNRLAQSELADVNKYLDIQREINSLKGGWSRGFNALPFNNIVRNIAGKVFKKPDESKTVETLAQRAYNALKDKVDQPDILREFKLVVDQADGRMTTRQELLDALNSVQGSLSQDIKQARTLSSHLDGFRLRTGRLLNMIGQRYRDDYDTIHTLGDQALVRKVRSESVLSKVGMPEATRESLLKAMGESPEAFEAALKGANLSEDAVASLKTIARQTEKVGELKGLGRGFVGLWNTMKRTFSGELFNDIFTGTGQKLGSAAADGFLSRAAQALKHGPGIILGGGFMFLNAILETLSADDTSAEKTKTFMRGFLGGGVGFALGWSFLQHINSSLNLDGKILGRNAHKVLFNAFDMVKATRAGVLVEIVGAMVIASQFDVIGRKVSDLLFGKPLHIQREEAKKKLQQAQRDQQRQAKQQLAEQMKRLAQGGNPLGATNPLPAQLPYAGAAALTGQGRSSAKGSPLSLPAAAANPLAALRGAGSSPGAGHSSGNQSHTPMISSLSPGDIANREQQPLRGLND